MSDPIERVRAKINEAGGSYRVRVPGTSDEDAAALQKLSDDGRPFLALDQGSVGADARDAFARLMRDALRSPLDGIDAVREGVAAVIQQHVMARFEAQGADVALRALSPAYLRRKIREGYDARIGYRTGALVRRLTASAWTLEKDR